MVALVSYPPTFLKIALLVTPFLLLLDGGQELSAQRLSPMEAPHVETPHVETPHVEARVIDNSFIDLWFRQPESPSLGFDLDVGVIAGDLYSDAQFRELESLMVGAQFAAPQIPQHDVIYDVAVRPTSWAAPEPLRAQEATRGDSTSADSPNNTAGFAALEQPKIEAFPPEADRIVRAEAAETPRPQTAAETRLPSTVGPQAIAVPAGPALPTQNLSIGPAMPEGVSYEKPISEQVIGELSVQIQIQKEIAENEPEAERELHLKLVEDARKAIAQANKYMWKDISQLNRIRNFEQDRALLMAELENSRPISEPESGTSATELFEKVDQLRADLSEKNDRLREISKAELQREKRMKKIPEERTKSKSALADNQRQMKLQESGEADRYVLIVLRAQELELEYQIKALSSESKLHELENRLLPMRGDFLAREIKLLETEIDSWNHAANEQRRSDIAEEVRQARLKAIEAAPALKTLANTAAALTQQRAEIAEKIRLASEEDLSVQSDLNFVKNQYEQVEKSVVGRSSDEANGILMVEIRRKLPRPFQSLARVSEIKAEQRKLSLKQLELNEERKPLSHPMEYVDQRFADIVSEKLSEEELLSMALEFVENIRTQYDQLSSDHHQYTELLAKIAAERKELIHEITTTMAFVDEKSLWMQSAKSLGIDHLRKSKVGAKEFFSPAQWWGLFDCLSCRMTTRPHESAAGFFGLVALFVFSRRFKG